MAHFYVTLFPPLACLSSISSSASFQVFPGPPPPPHPISRPDGWVYISFPPPPLLPAEAPPVGITPPPLLFLSRKSGKLVIDRLLFVYPHPLRLRTTTQLPSRYIIRAN